LQKDLYLGVQGSLRLHGFRVGGCVRQDGFLSLVSMNVVFLLCATVGVEVRWEFLAGHGNWERAPLHIDISPLSWTDGTTAIIELLVL